MKQIAFYSCHPETDLWLAPLKSALMDTELCVWPDVAEAADIAIVWAPTQAFFDAHPTIKLIFNMGAGVDAILALNLPSEVSIVRVEDGGMASQLAEYCCEAVIRFYREFPVYEQQRQQHLWHGNLLHNRDDYPVGIMGLGVLGKKIAQALRQFDYPVNGWSQQVKQIPGVQCYGAEQLTEFLQASRVLICVLPLTDKTRGIINYQHLSQLQPQSYLINVARGGHVIEADLIRLIDEGRVQGATLDVTQHEPLPPSDALWQNPNIRITPHIAGKTQVNQVLDQIIPQIRMWQQSGEVSRAIDLTRGY